MNDNHEGPTTGEGGGRRYKVVYTIVENRERKFWLRVGVGFENRDGSWNIRLDAVPVNGTLHMRDPDPADQRDGSGSGGRRRDANRDGNAFSSQGVQ